MDNHSADLFQVGMVTNSVVNSGSIKKNKKIPAWDEYKETYSFQVGKYVRNLRVKLFITVRILKKKSYLFHFNDM